MGNDSLRQFLRFGVVGVVNTVVDLSLYIVLVSTIFPIWAANLASTSIALAVSLTLNSRYTFRSADGITGGIMAKYIIVTLIGLWVLHPVVIYMSTDSISNFVYGHSWALTAPIASELAALLPKILAICIGLLWNYTLYDRYVFLRKEGSATR
ncbi:hypothetical protein CR970_01565 [Candidatus Saccharibacteria bacterium]|nr:MAG: hypothetical protein CR970_01565 [Candidatus Saccharibacteria bacterium]